MNFLNKGKRKNLIYFLLIGLILSVLILCLPVNAGVYSDPLSSVTPSGKVLNTTQVYFNCDTGSAFCFDPRGYCSDNNNVDITEERAAGFYTNGGFSGMYYDTPFGCEAGKYCFISSAQGYDGTGCGGDKGGYYKVGYYMGTGAYNFHTVASFEYGETIIGDTDFTSDVTSGQIPLTVTFYDNTTGFTPIGNYWDFGDGYTYNPQDFEPTIIHTYMNDGFYDIKYASWDIGLINFDWANKTAYIEATATVGNSTSGYQMFVNPETVIYNNNFTITTTSNSNGFSGITNIKFGYTKGTEANVLDSADGNILDYVNTSGTWYQFNVNTHLYDIPLTGVPSTIIDIPAKMGSGTYTIDGYITKTTGQVIHLTDSLIITTTNLQTLTIDAKDFDTGDLISTAHIKVLNIAADTWDNRSASGEEVFYYPFNQELYIEIPATGYATGYKNWTITNVPAYNLWVIMYRGTSPPASNVTVHIEVIDGWDNSYLQNAKVQLSDNQVKYTTAAGTATFTTLENTDYLVSVSKSGFQPTSKLFNTGTGGTAIDELITLHRITTTTVPTTIPTTAPGGYTGGIGGNITPVTCQVTMPKGSTLLDTLRNNMACAGIQSGQNQGYGIALMIIFTLGIIGGKYGKGMGVVMGMASGYVLSLAMGLVPLWTFIAMIVFICLILAVKIWSAPSG